MSIIEVNNLTQIYKTKQKSIIALDDISFSIEKGDTVGLIGMNGAGKSTTIKILTGVLKPTKGSVKVCGKVPYLKRNSICHKYGVMFGQRSQLWWDLPAIDSFYINGSLYGFSKKQVRNKLASFKEILDMPYLNIPVRQLSLGQKMVCDLFLILLHEPELLFLDEATIAMDVINRKNILDLISKVNSELKKTMIFTSHSLSDIESVCKKVILIDKGKIVYDGLLEVFLNSSDKNIKIQIKYKSLEFMQRDKYNLEKKFNLLGTCQGYYLTLYCKDDKRITKEITECMYSNPYIEELNIGSISLEDRLLLMDGVSK